MTLHEYVPREHGAWAMWIVPMLSAALVTRFTLPLLVFFVLFGVLYILHHPLVIIFKRKNTISRRDIGILTIAGLMALTMGGVLILRFHLVWLLIFAGIETLVFVASVRSFLNREQRSVVNELVTVAALTLSGPAAYYVVTGTINESAAILYSLNFLFFGSSVFYVKMRLEFLRARGVWKNEASLARLWTVGYHLLLPLVVSAAALAGIFRWEIILAFVPLLIQVAMGTISNAGKMNFTRLGVALVLQSVVFLGVLAVFLR